MGACLGKRKSSTSKDGKDSASSNQFKRFATEKEDGDRGMPGKSVAPKTRGQSSGYYRDQDINLVSLKRGIVKFNGIPKQGIDYLVRSGLLEREPDAIARFLFNGGTLPDGRCCYEALSKRAVGEYIGSAGKDEESRRWSRDVLDSYSRLFDFRGRGLVPALRLFLSAFRLPGEAQVIDRIMTRFADTFHRDNPPPECALSNADAAYVLAFGAIMLNTDLHKANMGGRKGGRGGPGRGERMTKEQFIRNMSGVNAEYIGGGKAAADALFGTVYDDIAAVPLALEVGKEATDTVTFYAPAKQGWLLKRGSGGVVRWKKRFFLLTDGCLYYFMQPAHIASAQPRCILPLDNAEVLPQGALSLRIIPSEYSAYAEVGEGGGGDSSGEGGSASARSIILQARRKGQVTLKSAKRMDDGSLVRGSHTEFVLQASSREERDEWMTALSAHTVRAPLQRLRRQSTVRARGAELASMAMAGADASPVAPLALNLTLSDISSVRPDALSITLTEEHRATLADAAAAALRLANPAAVDSPDGDRGVQGEDKENMNLSLLGTADKAPSKDKEAQTGSGSGTNGGTGGSFSSSDSDAADAILASVSKKSIDFSAPASGGEGQLADVDGVKKASVSASGLGTQASISSGSSTPSSLPQAAAQAHLQLLLMAQQALRVHGVAGVEEAGLGRGDGERGSVDGGFQGRESTAMSMPPSPNIPAFGAQGYVHARTASGVASAAFETASDISSIDEEDRNIGLDDEDFDAYDVDNNSLNLDEREQECSHGEGSGHSRGYTHRSPAAAVQSESAMQTGLPHAHVRNLTGTLLPMGSGSGPGLGLDEDAGPGADGWGEDRRVRGLKSLEAFGAGLMAGHGPNAGFSRTLRSDSDADVADSVLNRSSSSAAADHTGHGPLQNMSAQSMSAAAGKGAGVPTPLPPSRLRVIRPPSVQDRVMLAGGRLSGGGVSVPSSGPSSARKPGVQRTSAAAPSPSAAPASSLFRPVIQPPAAQHRPSTWMRMSMVGASAEGVGKEEERGLVAGSGSSSERDSGSAGEGSGRLGGSAQRLSFDAAGRGGDLHGNEEDAGVGGSGGLHVSVRVSATPGRPAAGGQSGLSISNGSGSGHQSSSAATHGSAFKASAATPGMHKRGGSAFHANATMGVAENSSLARSRMDTADDGMHLASRSLLGSPSGAADASFEPLFMPPLPSQTVGRASEADVPVEVVQLRLQGQLDSQ